MTILIAVILIGLILLVSSYKTLRHPERKLPTQPTQEKDPEEVEDEDRGQGPFYALLKTWNSHAKTSRVCVFNHLRCFCYAIGDESLLTESLCPSFTYPPSFKTDPKFLNTLKGISDIDLPETRTPEQKAAAISADRHRSLVMKTIYCSTCFHGKIKRVKDKTEDLKKFQASTLSELLKKVQKEVDSRVALENL